MDLAPGLIIAAPGSGAGKTTVTLAVLAHLRQQGVAVASAKVGPDFIDPAYHSAATGRPCHNLDAWAMSEETLAELAFGLGQTASIVVVEGVMGLFDGAPDGTGSAADLARRTGWPVVLVVDASGMARSAAALVHGFATFDPEVSCAGVIFNRTGSRRHGDLLRAAMAGSGIAVFGCLQRDDQLTLPDRHLGLVQAREHPDLEHFLARAGARLADAVDIAALQGASRPGRLGGGSGDGGAGDGRPDRNTRPALPPPGQRIAVADDLAFAFAYPYVLEAWQRAGASISPFSPLADQAPPAHCDAVFLPGGYPELHAEAISHASTFRAGMHQLAHRGCPVYGECGGYMVLGQSLTDRGGATHAMLGLLPVRSSFEHPRLHLGYRDVTVLADSALGPLGARYRGHEFHFATELDGNDARRPPQPLFQARDVSGALLGDTGMQLGSVCGSFMHLMDRRDDLNKHG